MMIAFISYSPYPLPESHDRPAIMAYRLIIIMIVANFKPGQNINKIHLPPIAVFAKTICHDQHPID